VLASGSWVGMGMVQVQVVAVVAVAAAAVGANARSLVPKCLLQSLRVQVRSMGCLPAHLRMVAPKTTVEHDQ
jgi:hypothetical protein